MTSFDTEIFMPVDQSQELVWESCYTNDSLLDDIHLNYVEHLLCHHYRQSRKLINSAIEMNCIAIARFLALSIKRDDSLVVVPCVGVDGDPKDWGVDFSRSEFIDYDKLRLMREVEWI